MHTHTKINTNSALEHTIRLAKNTIEIGDHSITTLHHQELQLKNMQKELNTMNDDLNTGERLLRSIESVGGQISNWFRSDRSHKHQDEGEQFEADMEQIKEDRTRFEFARYKQEIDEHDRIRKQTKPIRTRNREFNQIIANQDEQLDTITDLLSEIKHRAILMDNSISDSNTRLDKIAEDTENANVKIRRQTNKAYRIAHR
eukprot:TRINITY_DN4599_c0_g1_i1.p1 TRINITY_DN4599_c0_g1~~TRINITY_DN4599_c0_g1_i1.p1  ORF type:complete len:201 (-),score=34.27 TRINITY_DN4599_c0_g1_i1:64-666(-)